MTFWNRRSKAPSFSMEFLYSSSVVAPIHCITPRANAGLRILAASIEPGVEPAPMRVWISSMKMMTSSFCSSSLMSCRMRSSNCPIYFVPATTPVRSSVNTRLPNNKGGHFLLAMACANPSTIALFPTPGSPIRIGLFFFLRPRISMTRIISFSRPTTSSSLLFRAWRVRSVEKLSSMGVFDFCLSCCVVVVFPLLWLEELAFFCSSSNSSSGSPTPFVTWSKERISS